VIRLNSILNVGRYQSRGEHKSNFRFDGIAPFAASSANSLQLENEGSLSSAYQALVVLANSQRVIYGQAIDIGRKTNVSDKYLVVQQTDSCGSLL